MRKVLTLQLFFIFCFTLLVTSCSKDGDGGLAPCSAAWATDLQSEVTAFVTAQAAFGADPSDANCNAYKSALQNYINALKPYGNCATLTGQTRTDWQEAVAEAEADVATLCQ